MPKSARGFVGGANASQGSYDYSHTSRARGNQPAANESFGTKMEMLISPTNDVAESIGNIDSKQKENNAIIG